MPISKKRKKKGKAVKGRSLAVRDDRPSGVTLQDLINVLAFQEYQQQGVYDDVETEGFPPGAIIDEVPTVEDIDFEAPDTQAVIRAVEEASKYKKENQDER